jgi:Zn-dependent peptidase ImmA (M78 family)
MDSHKQYIEKIASQALKKAACNESPISVEDVARSLGLEVIHFSFHQKISGLLKKEEGIIAVNKNHNPVRQRFSAAHELGHFLLGHGMEDVTDVEIIDDSFAKVDLKEREANLFASFLLMPADKVKAAAKKEGLDIEKLALLFGVSKQAMAIRLLALGLI